MTAPAEPLPWDDDELPDAVIDAGLAAHDAAIREPDDELGGWIDDALSAEIDAELAASSERAPEQPCWAVPGLDGDGGQGGAGGNGGLSARSSAVLAETAAAATAVRLAQARFYRALSALHASDAVAESGYRHSSRLLAEHVRLDTTEATRLARHAHCLTGATSPTGAVLPAALPATAAHVHTGVIGPGHVEVIRRTMARLAALTPALAEHVLATTETELADTALVHPTRLHRPPTKTTPQPTLATPHRSGRLSRTVLAVSLFFGASALDMAAAERRRDDAFGQARVDKPLPTRASRRRL